MQKLLKILLNEQEVNINATDIRNILNKKIKTEEDIKYLELVLPCSANLKTPRCLKIQTLTLAKSS